jgi:2-iminobutanoate/2-iminopropanoate deaminase
VPKHPICTAEAPSAIGPYCQAIRAGNVIYTSGQIPLDPRSSELVGPDIEAATRRVLDNLREVLAAGGAQMADVVKTTVFLVDLEDFAQVNRIYAEYFQPPHPARSTVQVSRLPRGARIEIEAIACCSAPEDARTSRSFGDPA